MTIQVQFLHGTRAGQTAEIPGDSLTFGRDPTSGVVLDDPQSSWNHARLDWHAEVRSLALTDLGSRNGTFAGAPEIKLEGPVWLPIGTQFRIGQSVFSARFVEAPVQPRSEPDPTATPATLAVSRHDIPGLLAGQGAPTRSAQPTSGAAAGESGTIILDPPIAAREEGLSSQVRLRPRVRFLIGGDEGRVAYLAPGETRLGRGAGSDVRFTDPLVSSHHCTLSVDAGGRTTLRAGLVTNPITVNGQKETAARVLVQGDLMTVGASVLEFIAAGEEMTIGHAGSKPHAGQARFLLPGLVLVQPELRIGRDPTCDLFLDDQSVDRHHATIYFGGRRFLLRDTSERSLRVNGKPFAGGPLAERDEIAIGKFVVRVQIRDDILAVVVGFPPQVAQRETFAQAVDVNDPFRTLYRRVLPVDSTGESGAAGGLPQPDPQAKPGRSPSPGSVAGTADVPARSVRWVAPLEVHRGRALFVLASLACLLVALAFGFGSWRAAAPFASRPLSPAHAMGPTDTDHRGNSGHPPSACRDCHEPFRGTPASRCTTCHAVKVKKSHSALECGACHLEHPADAVPLALVAPERCASATCHGERHRKLTVAPPGPSELKLVVAKPYALRAGLDVASLHAAHAMLPGRCNGCHSNVGRTGPVNPSSSCLRCHGPADRLEDNCARCHTEHSRPTLSLAHAEPGPAGTPPRGRASPGSRGPREGTQPGSRMLAWLVLLPFACAFLWLVRSERRRVTGLVEFDSPASESPVATTKKRIEISASRCTGCASCVRECPYQVLQLIDERQPSGHTKRIAAVVNFASCNECGTCESACEPRALVRLMPGEPLPTVERPDLDASLMSRVPGLFVVGQATGESQIRNAINHGARTIEYILHSGVRPGTAAHAGVQVEVAIIGGGPAGLSAGLLAAQRGLSHIVFEKGPEFAQTIRNYPKRKPVQSHPLEVAAIGPLSISDTSKEELIKVWEDEVSRERNLRVQYNSEVTDVRPRGENPAAGFEIVTPQGVVTALRVLVAVGTRGTPRILPILGFELPKVKHILVDAEMHRGHHVVVIGAGNIALEAAIALADATGPDCPVRLVYRAKEFSQVSSTNRAGIEARIAAGRIIAHPGTMPSKIEASSVTLSCPPDGGETTVVRNDFVYSLIPPNDSRKWLEKIGVAFDSKDYLFSLPPSDDLSFKT